ncbi:MAG: hypothetical protein ACE3K5_29520, partial [Candidatus Pristimantibacillus sp.]
MGCYRAPTYPNDAARFKYANFNSLVDQRARICVAPSPAPTPQIEGVREAASKELAISRDQRPESREQRAESREQRAESREQRAESREQRTENREQRTENREQRTENREQRTENREQ